MISPRDYQIDAVERCSKAIATKGRTLILQASCGAGKTICACIVMQRAVTKGKKALFIAGARQLIYQCSNKLRDFGLHHGVIMAGHGYTRAPIQVASKDTLVSRGIKRETIELPEADIVIIDEAHLMTGKTARGIIDRYPKAVILGLTATPATAQGKMIGRFYNSMVQVIPTSKLIEMGHLVPLTCYAPQKPDLKGVPTSKGDYVVKHLEKRMNRAEITGNIVRHWLDHGENRPTVAFAVNIAHSKSIADSFLKAGVKAEHVDGTMEQEVRQEIFKRFELGETKLVSSCNVLHTGTDFPWVSCGILARPTKSFVLFIQMCGRIMRSYDGALGTKRNSILLDHANCIKYHGVFPDEDIDWDIQRGQTIQQKIKDSKPPSEGKIFTCPKCKLQFRKTNICPGCGYKLPDKTRVADVHQKDGVLVLIKKAPNEAAQLEVLAREWHRSLAIAAARNGTVAMAVALFIKNTNTKPWSVRGLPNAPSSDNMKKNVREVFPGYNRTRHIL